MKNNRIIKSIIIVSAIAVCIAAAAKIITASNVSADERYWTVIFSRFTDAEGNEYTNEEPDSLVLVIKDGTMDGVTMEQKSVSNTAGTVTYTARTSMTDPKTADITPPILFKEEASGQDHEYSLNETYDGISFTPYVSEYVTYDDEGTEFVIIKAESANGELIPSAFTLEVNGEKLQMATRDISFNIEGEFTDTCIMFYGIDYDELEDAEVRICITDVMRKYTAGSYEIIK